jgi:hypothetical protein
MGGGEGGGGQREKAAVGTVAETTAVEAAAWNIVWLRDSMVL